MYRKSLSTKENIMLAFIKLLSDKDVEQVSMTDIAREANVAVGLINYHFKTKESLSNMAIEYYMAKTIKEESSHILARELEPTEQLIASLNGFADFLARHKEISRLYLINSISRTGSSRMARLGYEHYFPILRNIFKDRSDIDLVLIIYPIVSTIQMMFLNNGALKEAINIDYFCEKERHLIIEKLVDNSLKTNGVRGM